jgi:hypothetical protein
LKFGSEFSNQLIDLIRKMIEPRQSERIEILEIGNHPWMMGFSVAEKMVVPKPIQFFRINELSDILKFRRKFVNVDGEILRKTCEFLGFEDEEMLREVLKEGMITDETTVYYLMSSPCQEEPHVPRPPAAVGGGVGVGIGMGVVVGGGGMGGGMGMGRQLGVSGRRKIEMERAMKQREREKEKERSPKNSAPKIRRPEASPRSPRVRMFL